MQIKNGKSNRSNPQKYFSIEFWLKHQQENFEKKKINFSFNKNLLHNWNLINFKNMREIIFIQVGQCGNKVGEKVSQLKWIHEQFSSKLIF